MEINNLVDNLQRLGKTAVNEVIVAGALKLLGNIDVGNIISSILPYWNWVHGVSAIPTVCLRNSQEGSN